MVRQIALWLLVSASAALFNSCVSQEKPVGLTPAFGEPISTIPWNQPQRWEGGAGGFNALRGNEENN